jgi:hypothetical protein
MPLLFLQKFRIRDAAYRYQYALKKLPAEAEDDAFDTDRNTFGDLRVNLLLNLSRCRRKLNVSEATWYIWTDECWPQLFELCIRLRRHFFLFPFGYKWLWNDEIWPVARHRWIVRICFNIDHDVRLSRNTRTCWLFSGVCWCNRTCYKGHRNQTTLLRGILHEGKSEERWQVIVAVCQSTRVSVLCDSRALECALWLTRGTTERFIVWQYAQRIYISKANANI